MMKQEADLDSEKQIYLTCEKYYIFELLIFAAGFFFERPWKLVGAAGACILLNLLTECYIESL